MDGIDRAMRARSRTVVTPRNVAYRVRTAEHVSTVGSEVRWTHDEPGHDGVTFNAGPGLGSVCRAGRTEEGEW